MKKRIQALVMCIVLILSMSVVSTVHADNITVRLYGQPLTFDVQPQIINGRTMVPMRTIFEKLGATVEWDQASRTVTSVKGDTTIRLTIDIPSIRINQQVPRELDAAPCIVDGRTLVPVRAISEAFHLNVDWDGTTRTVLITAPNVNIVPYNVLKNEILNRGQKSSVGSDYYIYYTPSSKLYSMMFSYEPTADFLSIYFSHEQKTYGIKTSVCIFLYEDANPAVLYTSRFSTGEEYRMHAEFPYVTKPLVITSNTIPDEVFDDAYDLLNSELLLMDLSTQYQIGISFEDLGLYYEKE